MKDYYKNPRAIQSSEYFAVFNLQSREWEGTYWEEHTRSLEHESIREIRRYPRFYKEFHFVEIDILILVEYSEVVWSEPASKMMLQVH